MRRIFTLLVLSLLLMSTHSAYAQSATKHRVVIQLSTSDTAAWTGAINNITHLKKGWGDDVSIELVAHGPGIGFLVSGMTTKQAAIKALTAQGVRFVACENTLRARKIDKSQVIPEAGTVPMGVGEIVMKQEEGWSYLKAGF